MLNDIMIMDDVFEMSELEYINMWCLDAPMYFKQHGNPRIGGVPNTRFAYHFGPENDVFVDSVKSNVLSKSGLDIESLKCYDAYINFYNFGTPTVIHEDSYEKNKTLTVLFFATRRWNPDWGGELIFYDKKLEANRVVSYKPNRFVLFDGSIQHCVKQPSVIAQGPRYSIATKFELKND